MTECELCKGTGKLIKPWYDTTGAMTGMTGDICFMCDGKGTICEPMTNEEWFTSLSTEEKAKTIVCLAVNSMHKKRKGLIENDVNEIMRWLKEKHYDK